jgi:MFS-type transporter involved in bile tolerance (Atg22 family)
VLGPLLMGITASLTGSSRVAILTILMLFIVGAGLLCVVREGEDSFLSDRNG